MSAYNYPETLARLRAECEKCAAGAGRPEHVSPLSWHEWGHRSEGALDVEHPVCVCGTELRNGARFWHCGGCHKTFAGEKPFVRHRRGPGRARECAGLQNGGPSQYWSDERGVWHHGPRREVPGPPGTSGATILPVAA